MSFFLNCVVNKQADIHSCIRLTDGRLDAWMSVCVVVEPLNDFFVRSYGRQLYQCQSSRGSSSSRVNIPLKPMTHSSHFTHTIFFSDNILVCTHFAVRRCMGVVDKSRHVYIIGADFFRTKNRCDFRLTILVTVDSTQPPKECFWSTADHSIQTGIICLEKTLTL